MNEIIGVTPSCELLIENEFYNDLGEIMEDPKYKPFFDKYFYTNIDIKSTLFYMQLYRQIQLKYKEKKGIDVDKMTNIAIIKAYDEIKFNKNYLKACKLIFKNLIISPINLIEYLFKEIYKKIKV